MANEKRLIDANALKDALSNLEASGGHEYYRKGMDDTLHFHMPNIIDDAPTVDAVEVPCKIGQTVYVINGLWVSNYVVTHFWYDGCFFKFKAINEEYAYECRDFSFFDERIGKTVFFTYEQAESALKKMYGGNEDGSA